MSSSMDNSYMPSKMWDETRTTRTPPFWDTTRHPMIPILVIHIRSQVNRRQSQSYKFKKKTRTIRTPAFWGYPPPPHDYPYHWVILDPKSKEDKVKVTNLKNSPKFQILIFWNEHYTRHTFWSCLIRCANMKWIRWVFLKIQSGHDSVHRRTDGQMDGRTDGPTDKVIPVYPPINFVEAGGIKNANNSNFGILLETLHVTQLLKLFDIMHKYEMEVDPIRTVGATERTQDAERTEGETDGGTEWNQYTPPTTSLCNKYDHLSIPKLQGCCYWSLGKSMKFHPTLYNGCNYLC